ncbi:hypothetical protein MFIFM68171_08885 [Madurella fahalii]|uniref:Uncharacterized protein n=1 Tax=Madurella fahalii TaxID=1157608 RepID=A0ABQ0GMA0_9PEZI
MKYSSALLLAATAFTGIWAAPAPQPVTTAKNALEQVASLPRGSDLSLSLDGTDVSVGVGKRSSPPAVNWGGVTHPAKRQTTVLGLAPDQLTALANSLGLPLDQVLASVTQVETFVTGLLGAAGLSVTLLVQLTAAQVGLLISTLLTLANLSPTGVLALLPLSLDQVLAQLTPILSNVTALVTQLLASLGL